MRYSEYWPEYLREHSKPAAASHPFWWSVLNDLRMLWHFLTGGLAAELQKAGVTQAE